MLIAEVAEVAGSGGVDWFSDVALPVAAIIVPTVLAVMLYRGERKAAARERAEERAVAEVAAKADRERADRAAVAEAARVRTEREGVAAEFILDASSLLLEAAYSNDIRHAATLQVRADRLMAKVVTNMSESDDHISNWFLVELGVMARGLDERNRLSLPVMLEKITWRADALKRVSIDWRTGEKDVTWFETAQHLPLSETPPAEYHPLP